MTRGALLAAVALVGCAPVVVWRDATGRVQVTEHSLKQRVVRGGTAGPAYEAVAMETVSAEGHVYAAQTGAGWVVDDHGVVGRSWSGVGAVATAGARVAYAATEGDDWFVVDGWRVHGPFVALQRRGLRFCGRRLAFIARTGGAWRVHVEGRFTRTHHRVEPLVCDQHRTAYVAYDEDGGAYAVVDGRREDTWLAVAAPVLHPVTAAYLARDSRGWHAVVDAVPGPAYEALSPVRFSRLARSAYVGRELGEDVVVVDGRRRVRRRRVDWRSLGWRGEEPVYASEGRLGWMVFDGANDQGPYRRVGQVATADARLAYVAHDGARPLVVADGREHRYEQVVDGSLVATPDGWAWVAVARGAASVYVDGRAARPVDYDAVAAMVQRTRGPIDGAPLRRWMRATFAAVGSPRL